MLGDLHIHVSPPLTLAPEPPSITAPLPFFVFFIAFVRTLCYSILECKCQFQGQRLCLIHSHISVLRNVLGVLLSEGRTSARLIF